MSPPPPPTDVDSPICFGPFALLPEGRVLLENGQPVRLGGRALSLLTTLLQRPAEVILKADLMAPAWPGVAAEETTLRRVQIGAPRKVLGDGQDGVRCVAEGGGATKNHAAT